MILAGRDSRKRFFLQTEKAVAILEALKGLLVMLAGFAFFDIFYRGAQQAAEGLVRRMHLNPASQYPRIFIESAGKITRENLLWMAAAAAAYVAARFVEAYGLWRGYAWARLFAILAGLIYIPFEIYHILLHFTWMGIGVLLFNLMIVRALWAAHRLGRGGLANNTAASLAAPR